MIVSWVSLDNRKAARAKVSRARKAGIDVAIRRVTTEDVAQHIVTLTVYLTSPNKAHLDKLVAIETVRQHVVHYIGSQKRGDDDISDAEVEAARKGADGERVQHILTRNILSRHLEDIQVEMGLVVGLAPGSEDPIEHIILSWPAGEHPTNEQIEEALDIVLAVAGMSRHQAYAVLHGDTDNDHLHIALNRVDPCTGQRVQIGLGLERSIETLHQSLAIIEHRQGWATQTNALYHADASGCYDRSTGIKVRDAAMYPCASHVDQKRIREVRAREKLERRISDAARDYERRTGFECLQRRVIVTAAPIAKDAATWDDLHRGLAREGMRYRMLKDGAVIECGDRTIAASAAWGGASAAKMTERLGPFEEPPDGLRVAQFEERVIPTLRDVAEKRLARDAVRREQTILRESIEHANGLLGDRYAQIVTEDPRYATSALNEARKDASAELEPVKDAIQSLARHRREQYRRRRKQIDKEALLDVDQEDDIDGANGILIGCDAGTGAWSQSEVDPELRAVEGTDHISFYRDSQLVFVEYRDRIDVHATDDEALRAALRIAAGKWGSVVGIGDQRFLYRLARIAVEEGIELTNPELQSVIGRIRNNAAIERQLDELDQLRAVALKPAPAPTLPVNAHPSALRNYAPDFEQWLEMRADGNVSRGRVDSQAAAITASPKLSKQLAELESQQFAFAIELRRSARRYRALQRKVCEEQQAAWDDQPLEPFGRLPRLSDLMLSAKDLKRMPIEFAPEQPRFEPTVADAETNVTLAVDARHETGVASAAPPAPVSTKPEPDLDRKYRLARERKREREIREIKKEISEAIRARVGDVHMPPRHIAALVLRERARVGAGRSPHAKATDERDAADLAVLMRAPAFGQLMRDTKEEDPQHIAHLQRILEGPGDPLGRVPAVRGRLDFSHVSPHGYDPGAKPPLEWINESLAKIDFKRLRLTMHDRLVGVLDNDLLEATNHNYVGLLYPQIQAQLEVEWRLQCERDLAAQFRIQSGAIEITTKIDPEAEFASILVQRGATAEERAHIEIMGCDPNALLKSRAIERGELQVEAPRHPSTLVAAYLRAREDNADQAVLTSMVQRLRLEKPETTAMHPEDRAIVATAMAPSTADQKREQPAFRRARGPNLRPSILR